MKTSPLLSTSDNSFQLTFKESYMEMVMRGDVLWEAALVFAVTKWLLSFVMNYLTNSSSQSQGHQSSCCSSSSTSGLRMVKDSLFLTTIEGMEHRLPECNDLSCVVCLNELRKECEVWELRNCNHVFHKDCLERWISHDNRLTCPLCRASLLPVSPLPSVSLPQKPSWAVERMLYLFGDDLLP